MTEPDMFNSEDIGNVVERSTIYNVFPICSHYFKIITSHDEFSHLEELHTKHRLTWTILADIWKKCFEEKIQTDNIGLHAKLLYERHSAEIKTFQKILYKRKHNEQKLISSFEEESMILYYSFENKNIKNILNTIIEHSTG